MWLETRGALAIGPTNELPEVYFWWKVDDGHAVRLIHTVYGQGYVLRAPDVMEDRPTG